MWFESCCFTLNTPRCAWFLYREDKFPAEKHLPHQKLWEIIHFLLLWDLHCFPIQLEQFGGCDSISFHPPLKTVFVTSNMFIFYMVSSGHVFPWGSRSIVSPCWCLRSQEVTWPCGRRHSNCLWWCGGAWGRGWGRRAGRVDSKGHKWKSSVEMWCERQPREKTFTRMMLQISNQ